MSSIESLAYTVVLSTDPSSWASYAREVLGMSTSEAPGGGLYLKMDERDYRVLILPGDEDRYFASGWEVQGAAGLGEVRARLEAAGVDIAAGSEAELAQRQVTDMIVFTDPSGNRHEAMWGYNGAETAFRSPIGVSGFVTGELGLGHTVLPALAFDETMALFVDTLGFGVSDEFDFQPGPEAPVMRLRFLHCNGRHHSLALAEMPNPAGCVHMMVEVESMTEVGLAHDRMAARDVKLMATLGQHENDKMTSFYMMTPGNFALEFGWGGKIVDPASYQTTQTEQVSIWGHDFSVGFQ